MEWTYNGSMHKWWARIDGQKRGEPYNEARYDKYVYLTVCDLTTEGCAWWTAEITSVRIHGITTMGGHTSKVLAAMRLAMRHGKAMQRKVRYVARGAIK